MFWQSVWDGVLLLLNIKVWIFVFIYGLISFMVYNSFMSKAISEYSSDQIIKGGISFIMKKYLIDTLLIVTSIFFLSPIFFGKKSLANFSDVISGGLVLLVIVAVVTGIRLLIGMIDNHKSAFNLMGSSFSFLICICSIIIMSKGIFISNEVLSTKPLIYPSFWYGLWWILLSVPIFIIFSMCLGLVMLLFKETTRNTITNVIQIGMIFMLGLMFMRMYGSYVVSTNRDVFSFNAPVSNNISDGINWDDRIENDAATVCTLLNMSTEKSNVDNARMQIEEFAGKIKKYPVDKRDKLKQAGKIFIRFSDGLMTDLYIASNRLLNGEEIDLKSWSSNCKPQWDYLTTIYNVPNTLADFDTMDSLVVDMKLKAGFGELSELKEMRSTIKARQPFLLNVLKDAYYRMFREKYE